MNSYWEERYKSGGNSGLGSYGEFALHKALIINNLIDKYNIKTISDFGCGDGNQLSYLETYQTYHGYDISPEIIRLNNQHHADGHTFFHNKIDEMPSSELCLSLDVIYHILDINELIEHIKIIFAKSERFVVIFSSNHTNNENTSSHIIHRKFTDIVSEVVPDFELINEIDNNLTTSAKFFIYEKR